MDKCHNTFTEHKGPSGKWWVASDDEDEISSQEKNDKINPRKIAMEAKAQARYNNFKENQAKKRAEHEKTHKNIKRQERKYNKVENHECFNCGLLGHHEDTCTSKKLSVKRSEISWRAPHLKLLGLTTETDTEDNIRANYKKMALLLHPDKNSAPDATQQFQAINIAYNKLIQN